MQNKSFKRSISLLLSLTFLLSILPLNIAFANLQSHIKDLNLQYITSTNESLYNLSFNWTNPTEWSSTADGSYTNKDAPAGFRLEGLNATANERAWNTYANSTGAAINSANLSQNLQTGSIYEFRVTPYHYHTPNNGGSISANYDTTTTQETILFMTDIQVDAEGSGNTLKVTFDNPQYKGQNLFKSYRIYYQRGGSSVTNFTSSKTVNVADAENISQDTSRQGVQRLTFTITDQSIKQGDVYAVKVEPMYESNEARDTGNLSYKPITLNNVVKKLNFKNKTTKEYRVNNVAVSIPLTVQEDGKDYLKLKWSGISSSTGTIEKVEIYSGESENDIKNLLGTIYSSDAVYVNSWRVENPKKVTYYKLRVYISGVDVPVESVVATYNPNSVNITPNRPLIYLQEKVENNKKLINAYWEVFLRYPYNDNEKALAQPDGMYLDANVTYDLWISDNISNLSNVNLPKVKTISATELTKTSISNTSTPVYSYQLSEYTTIDKDGNFINKDIEENKTYYVKIIAKKPVDGKVPLSSDESIAQIYISASGNISTPQILSKPPLKIKTDSAGNKDIGKNHITIEWATKWFEIFDEKTQNWYTEISIRNDSLIFGSENILSTDKAVQFYDKYNEQLVRQEFITNGLSTEDAQKLIIRQIDLTSEDIKYELQTIDFSKIDSAGGYQAYIEKVLNSESTAWTSINPAINSNKAEYKVENLNKNTLYAVLLRPYRVVSNNKKEAYPNYIIGTTLPDDTDVVIKPITPSLLEKAHDDTSITVKWLSQGSTVSYELAISETKLDDPSKSEIKISSENIAANGTIITENLQNYVNYKIDSLFPSTGYYIWVRAIYKGATEVSSSWSSTLYVTTDSLTKPNPPSGFGLASMTNIKTYNSKNNTDYAQTNEKYIIVEWTRDQNDKTTATTFENNNSAEVLDYSSGSDTYMVRFKELTANKYYYFRIKTVLTVVKNGTDIQRNYSYVVEASLNKDFKDAITLKVPGNVTSTNKTLTIESDWSETYSFRTAFSKDDSEYDGDKNDSLYPLPTEDFEINYDFSTKTLTYRLRSNKKDSSGNADNLVDQRFISTLLQNKVYNYNLDLTTHNGYTISSRVVEIPYTVFKALEERKITLNLTAINTTFALKPGFLNTSEVKKLGDASVIKISLVQTPSSIPSLAYGQIYGSTPQKISLTVSNGDIKKEILQTGTDMEVILKLKNRYLATDTNISPFVQTPNSTQWQRVNGKYSVDSGSFKVLSKNLSTTYTTISSTTPVVANTSNNKTLDEVNNKIYLKDINNLDLTKPISVVQLNNMIAAVANGKKEVTMNTSLTTSDYNSLKRSNLLLEGSVISREQGVNALVKLYEIKTKSSYKNYTTVSTTTFKDISTANNNYKTSLLKASEIGFFGNETSSRPKSSMTIEEALYMINIILQDSEY